MMIMNVQQIQKVILKKRDPVTHLLFSELMANEGCQTNLSLAFWRNLVSHIQKALKKSAQYNVVIKTTFEQGTFQALPQVLSFFFSFRISETSANSPITLGQSSAKQGRLQSYVRLYGKRL